jgi:hypothetical protein
MSVSLDPVLCTEAANPNYTLGTFELLITPEGGVEFSLGNIASGNFTFTPNVIEHRRGIDNSRDAIFALGKDYTINITADEITARNLSVFLNEDLVTVAEGCKVPLVGERCTREYGVRLIHDFPCQDKTLTVVMWRAVILGEFVMEFSTDGFASFTGAVQALSCESFHPTEPYGYFLISEPCPSS